MTFSGEFNAKEVVEFVKSELLKMHFHLNGRKSILLKKGQKMIVTGLIVNEKENVPSYYRRKLRQEIYYCKKYTKASSGKGNDPIGIGGKIKLFR